MWGTCPDETRKRAELYAERNQLKFEQRLGEGIHGIVLFATGQGRAGGSAVKVHNARDAYLRERDCYFRLQQLGVTEILGHQVPRLIKHDDGLWVVEMTVVTRPYILDFAGAYLDHLPDYPNDAIAEWLEEKERQFGSDWPKVKMILARLRGFGIHVADINPGNVTFA